MEVRIMLLDMSTNLRRSSIGSLMTPFASLVRGNLLLRFSLLSLVVLLGIGLGLGWILQQQMERTALVQQADEISVVIDSVLGRHLKLADVSGAESAWGRTLWQNLAHRLLGADRHLVRIKVWDK